MLLTFHPSATDPRRTAPIVIQGGEDLNNKNIQIVEAPVITISGNIVDSAEEPNEVTLRRGPGEWLIEFGGVLGGSAWATDWAGIRPAGSRRWSFEFKGAYAPGSYEIHAARRTTRNYREKANTVIIEIRSSDIAGLTVRFP
jgi:hypothetical protein